MLTKTPPGARHQSNLPIRDKEALLKALKDANLPTLLMVYVQYTHDEAYLDKFEPYIRSVFSAHQTSIPDDLARELRSRLFSILTSLTPPEEKPVPLELMKKMMSVSVGAPVPDEFIPVLFDQMGFEKPVPRKDIPGRPAPPADFKILIIGAGMTGIAAGIKLDEAGYNYTIVEKNPDVGGTWLENVYPGVGVDTPSHFYSYSFEQNPNWSNYHPRGKEIQEYLTGVADKYGIRNKVIFNTRVVELRWDDDKSLWRVKTRTNDGVEKELEFNAILNAHGVLNRWSMPKIPGLETFKGIAKHTAGWDPKIDWKGKNVVVIGTGASGAQAAVAMAPDASHLTVLQRSKHWVLNNPELNLNVNDNIKFALREIPHYKEWFRFRVFWFTGDGLYANVCGDADWADKDFSISAQNDAVRKYATYHIQTKFADRPDLLDKMIPDYPIFGKRIVLDSDGGWLDTLKRPNVTLETRGLDHIEADGVVLKDGTRIPADIIVLATGFELTPALGNLQVYGRHGLHLNEAWGEDDARAYLGVMAPAFPNLFLTLGPNSAPNHAAGVNMVLEAQIHFVIETLDTLTAKRARAIEPSVEAYNSWNDKVEDQMKNMVWVHPKAKSYYLNSKGRNWVSCPFRLVDYWTWTRRPDMSAMHVDQ